MADAVTAVQQTVSETSRQHAPAPPKVSVVLVHWERAGVEDTVDCLKSLADVTYPNLEAILVNNGAQTFPSERFLEALPGLQILPTPTNLGFTGGNNIGIRRALADGADYVMLLNNDTVVSPDLVEKLLAAFDRPDVGIVGPIVTYFSHPNRAWFAGGTYNKYLGYTFHTLMGDDLTGPLPNQPIDFVTACALLARREVFEKVGLLWDALFIYFEDAELLPAGGSGRLSLRPRRRAAGAAQGLGQHGQRGRVSVLAAQGVLLRAQPAADGSAPPGRALVAGRAAGADRGDLPVQHPPVPPGPQLRGLARLPGRGSGTASSDGRASAPE